MRLSAPISPYEITFWRMLFATATVAVAWTLAPGPRRIPRDRVYILFGLVAALHFLLFVTSLSFTSIAHSLAITYMAPLFTAALSWRLLGEKLELRQIAGACIAVAGIAVLVGLEPRLTSRMLLGDGLALLSAACYGVYSIAGRSQRGRLGLLPYALAVYGLAAMWLLPAFATGFVARGGGEYTLARVLALAGAGVLPLGLGHTLYNASLRRMPATYANLIATQEVTGGVALGAILLGEIPAPNALAGAVLAVVGIILVLL